MDQKKQGPFGRDEYISSARRAAQPYDMRDFVEPPREVIDWDDRSNLGASRPPDELRQYNPGTRERIAQAMRGDAKATSLRGQLVEDIMGSTGLGRGTGLVDFVPGVGTALSADEALSDVIQGDYLSAVEGVIGMVPMGKIFKGITKHPRGRASGGGVPAPDDLGSPSSTRSMNSTRDYPGRITLREAADDPALLPPHEQLMSKEDELKRAYGLFRQEYERNNAPGRIDRERLNQAPYYGM